VVTFDDLGPVILDGEFVRLEPLQAEHADALLAAGADEHVWDHLAVVPRTREEMSSVVASALALQRTGESVAFVVRWKQSGQLVGSTRYLDIVRVHRRLEIGWTWYAPDFWGGPVNPECKLLMLAHAFDVCGAIRVQLKTDDRNHHSQRAIAKLGAVYEGTLRNHYIRRDGSFRHSVLFSIIDRDWPTVRVGLEARLRSQRNWIPTARETRG